MGRTRGDAIRLDLLPPTPGLSVVLVNAAGLIARWNQAAESLLGVSAQDALGSRPEDVMGTPRTVTGLFRPDLRAILAESGSWSGTLIYTRPDGSEILLQAIALQVPVDDGTGVLWLSHEPGADSDEHALGEAFALAGVERRRLMLVAEAGKLFSSSLDLDLVLVQVARRTAETLKDGCVIQLRDDDGSSRVGSAVHHWVPERLRQWREMMSKPMPAGEGLSAKVMAAGVPVVVEHFDPSMSGDVSDPKVKAALASLGIRSVIVVPLLLDGVAIGALVVMRDVTPEPFDGTDLQLCTDLAERATIAIRNAQLLSQVITAQADQAQAEQRMHQAERMEALGRLAGGIAHDFNNLLGVISLSTELAEHEVTVDSPAMRSLEMVRDATQRAADLTRQLLLFSRREPGDDRPMEVGAALAELERLLGRSLGDHIRFEVRVAPVPMWVRMDRARFEQVVMNLAVNARDAMPEGGVLRIAASTLHDSEAERSPSGEWCRLAVTDTGVGMSAELQKRVLEPFFTTKAVGSGTGLGLATVHGIVSEGGGSLRIDSRVGVGTTFEIELPCCPPPGADPHAALVEGAFEPVHGSGGEALLLVEDEPRLREALTTLLARTGFSVFTAVDGSDALEQLDAGLEVAVVVTDIGMPRLNGMQLVSALAARHPDVPVVLMTGYAGAAALESVAHAYLVHKPFSSRDLLLMIDRALVDARHSQV